MRKRVLTFIVAAAIVVILGFYWWRVTLPRFSAPLNAVSPLALNDAEQSLPFFELMSPLPLNADYWLVPKLEYRKGPPERFLERIQFLFVPKTNGVAKERVAYYGRRTKDETKFGLELPLYYQEVLQFALANKTDVLAALPWHQRLFAKLAFVSDAKQLLDDVANVTILDQSGTPAFLFEYKSAPARAKILFFRRSSLYQVELRSDTAFSLIKPIDFFRKSFLSQNRSDALSYVNQGLATLRFDAKDAADLSPDGLAWPLALLSANLSLDPASIDAYFHFAGLNALLFKSKQIDNADLETIDTLRNNVLAAALFAKDVSPDSPKTAEINLLSRNLVRGF
jgi:hypothetical protein